MPHDVFVSYSSKDKPIADAMCAALESRGVRCWIAPRDVVPGVDWGEAIVDAIAASRIMVLIFSAHANASSQVRREVERAVHRDVAVVPFRIDRAAPSKSLEYFISTPHWLDALNGPLEQHLHKLAETVKLLLTRPDALGAVTTTEKVAGTGTKVSVVPLPAGAPSPAVANRAATLGGRPIRRLALAAAALAAAVLLAGAISFWVGRQRSGHRDSSASSSGVPATAPATPVSGGATTAPIPVGGAEAATTEPVLAASAEAHGVVNLMPLIDPARDAVSGTWQVRPDGLHHAAPARAVRRLGRHLGAMNERSLSDARSSPTS